MMINKRLIAMVPEVKPFIFKKVVASWVSLLAGIVLWFTVAKTLEQVLEEGAVAQGTGTAFLVAGGCIVIRFFLTRLSAGYTHQAAACVKARLRPAIYD